MSFDAGAITAKLTLDATAFNTSLNTARQGVQKIGQDMTNLGTKIMQTTRQLSRVASSLTFLGAGITAPLVAAFKSAEKYSNSVRVELERFNNVFIKLRVSIAESLVPIMHKFSNALADLVKRWQALSPEMRESMLRTALLTGVFLTLGGIISSVAIKIALLIGYIVKLTGAMLKLAVVNPELLLIRIAIIAILVAMWKWKEVGDLVMNTLSILFDMAVIGLNSILYVANSLAGAFFAATTGVLKFAAATTAPWNKEAKRNLELQAEGAWKLAQQYTDLANNNLKKVADAGKNTFNTLTTGQSKFSEALNKGKEHIQAWIDLFDKIGSQKVDVEKMDEASKTFSEGWKDGLDAVALDLTNWGKMAEGIVKSLAQGMQTSLSNFFQGFLKGEIRSAKEMFVEFGNFVLKIISDVLAQIIASKLLSALGMGGNIFSSLFGGGGGAVSSGGYTIGNVPVTGSIHGGITAGFQEGTERIPYTGLYKLHAGEMVTPRYDATKHEAQKLTIYNMITPEAVAAAMSGKEGEGVIVNTINLNSLRNGVIRREVVKR